MAQNADDRISIRVSRKAKKVLQEKAKLDGRTLSNWAIKKLFTDDSPSSSTPVHGTKAVNG